MNENSQKQGQVSEVVSAGKSDGRPDMVIAAINTEGAKTKVRKCPATGTKCTHGCPPLGRCWILSD